MQFVMVDHSPQERRASTAGQEAQDAERIAKVLARAGVASRRAVERLIADGRVAINGRVLDTPAVKIEPGDIVTVDGKPVDAGAGQHLGDALGVLRLLTCG